MFHVPLFHYKVKDWENKKKYLLQLHESIQSDCTNLDNKGITNFHTDPEKIKQDIVFVFNDEIKQFINSIGSKTYNVDAAWFEQSNKNHYHGIHNHGGSGYSSVCFINYKENEHTPTYFLSPFNNFMNGKTLIHTPQNITEGSIIFFPSAIHHFTSPNESDEERMVVSFNLTLKSK